MSGLVNCGLLWFDLIIMKYCGVLWCIMYSGVSCIVGSSWCLTMINASYWCPGYMGPYITGLHGIHDEHGVYGEHGGLISYMSQSILEHPMHDRMSADEEVAREGRKSRYASFSTCASYSMHNILCSI